MQPQVLKRREGIQLSYNLPYKTYATQVYPRLSVNGSTVIIHAHEEGLGLVWYGGRAFRATKEDRQVNGDSIDLTEDEAHLPTAYEDEDDEVDESRPFHDVLTQLEIPLGSAAIRLGTLPALAERTIEGYPAFLESTIVIAVACADQIIRLVTVPLDPVPQGKQTQIQIVKLQGFPAHQDLIADLSITLTADNPEEDSSSRARSRSQGRKAEVTNSDVVPQQWSFLVASASSTGHGILLIHQVPFDSTGQISTEPEDHAPIHRCSLKSSVIGCRLSFNPSSYPSQRHSHLLISMPDSPAIKVYEALPSVDRLFKQRQESAANSDALRSTRPLGSSSAKPLINLMLPFLPQSTSNVLIQRKRALDAKWVLHGRAVVVLLEDGEWGIWDLETAGPALTTKSDNLVKGQSNVSGIRGGSLTKFAVRGMASSIGSSIKKGSSKSQTQPSSSLAPMTPHTRKARSGELFQDQSHGELPSISLGQLPQGGISVSTQPSNNNGPSKSPDESVVFSLGGVNIAIISLNGFWRSEIGGRGAFDTAGNTRPIVLPDLQISSNGQIAIHLLSTSGAITGTTTSQLSFLVATPTKFSILVQPLTGGSQLKSTLPLRFTDTRSINQDQTLLESGELDVEGMSRILDSMSQAPVATQKTVANGFGRKSVNFQFDQDEDVDMTTPTTVRDPRSNLTINKSSAGNRRLFT